MKVARLSLRSQVFAQRTCLILNIVGLLSSQIKSLQREMYSSELKVKIGSLTCTICNSLIWIDALVQVLAIEELGKHLLDLGDTSGTSHKNNFINLGLIQLGVSKSFLHRFQGSPEEVTAELGETSTGDVGVEINALEE